eukprot:1532100-Pleurochrysis_carterae.AAC.1
MRESWNLRAGCRVSGLRRQRECLCGARLNTLNGRLSRVQLTAARCDALLKEETTRKGGE